MYLDGENDSRFIEGLVDCEDFGALIRLDVIPRCRILLGPDD